MTHRPSLPATGGTSISGLPVSPAAVPHSLILGQEDTATLCTRRNLTQNDAGELQDCSVLPSDPKIHENSLNSSIMGQKPHSQPSFQANIDSSFSQSAITSASPGSVAHPAGLSIGPNLPQSAINPQFQGHSSNVTPGGYDSCPPDLHAAIASPPLKRPLDLPVTELTSKPMDLAPHEGPDSNASPPTSGALESEKSAKIAKMAEFVPNKESHVEDSTGSRTSPPPDECLQGPSYLPNDIPLEHVPPLPLSKPPILETPTSTPIDDPLSIGCTLFGVSRVKPVDELSTCASLRDPVDYVPPSLDYINFLDRFDSLIHDDNPTLSTIGSTRSFQYVSQDITSIISICTLNALLFNSLSPMAKARTSRLLAPLFEGSDHDLIAQLHLLHYYALRMALAFVSGASLYDARSHLFGHLQLERHLLAPQSPPWFSHSTVGTEVLGSLRAAFFAPSVDSSGALCAYPLSWVEASPFSTECELHPLHIWPSSSVWWEEDIISERCKLKVAPNHVGHILRLSAREWRLTPLRVPSLVMSERTWIEPILDEWCTNSLILHDPTCPHTLCKCHRGPSTHCSWRCKKNHHTGCKKMNHARFHDHFRFYMVHNSKELLPDYCSGMPVVSSPKYKGLPPYTLLEFHLHRGYCAAPINPLVGTSPEPSHPRQQSNVVPPQEASLGTSLFRLEKWSINALLLLRSTMSKKGRPRRALHIALANFQGFVRAHTGQLDLPYGHSVSSQFRHVCGELLHVTNELIRDGVLEWAQMPREEAHLILDFHRLYIRLRPNLHRLPPTHETTITGSNVIEVDAIGVEPMYELPQPSKPLMEVCEIIPLAKEGVPLVVKPLPKMTTPPSPVHTSTPDLEELSPSRFPLNTSQEPLATLSTEWAKTPTGLEVNIEPWSLESDLHAFPPNDDSFQDDLSFQDCDWGGINTLTAAPVVGYPFISTHAPLRPAPNRVTLAFMAQYSQVREGWIRYDHTIGVLVVRLDIGGIMVNAAVDLAAKYSLMSLAYYTAKHLDLDTYPHAPFFGVGPYGVPRIWTRKIRRTAAVINGIPTDFEAYLSNEDEPVNFTFILGRDWADRHGAMVGSMHSPFQLLLHLPTTEPIDSFEGPLRWNDQPTTNLETVELRAAAIHEAHQAHSLMLEAVATIRPSSLEPPLLVGVRFFPPDPIDTTTDSDYELDDDLDDDLDYTTDEDEAPMPMTGLAPV